MMGNLLLLALGMFATMTVAKAQRYFGTATGNYGGTNALYLNPALLAGSKVKWSVDLFSFNAGVDNNFATLRTAKLVKRLTDADGFKIGDFLNYGNDSKVDLTVPCTEVRGPGVYLNLNDKHSFALTTRARELNQFRNFGGTLFQSIVTQDFQDASGNVNIHDRNFGWTANVWSEIGLTYATTLVNTGKHVLHGGLTLRYLGGAGYINLYGENLDADYYNAQDSLVVSNSSLHINSNIPTDEDGLINMVNGKGFLNALTGKASGHGFGADLGFTYEYRPDYKNATYEMDGNQFRLDPGKDAYLFRISAAVTDWGSMRYKKNNFQSVVTGNGTLNVDEVGDHSGTADELTDYLKQNGFEIDSSTGNAGTVYLPTALVLGFDWHAYKHIFVNATVVGGMGKAVAKAANVSYSQLTVTPRYDSRIVSVGLPLTYNFTSQSFKAGLGLRVAGLFLGSDDLLALAGSGGQKGVNFYLGVSVPFAKHRLKDKDGDKVSDKKDKCPELQGEWELQGCPPTDAEEDEGAKE
ncbi:MAG: DUF5723 family protein [Edaphocola sp.]